MFKDHSSLQFFFQLKGQMCLKVVEKDSHKDIPIAEGEVCVKNAATVRMMRVTINDILSFSLPSVISIPVGSLTHHRDMKTQWDW